MQRTNNIFWLCSIAILALSKPLIAGAMQNGDLYKILPESDVVCVGTVINVSSFQRSIFDSGGGFEVATQTSKAKVIIETVLVGSLSKSELDLIYPIPDFPIRPSSTSLQYPKIVVGERALFFLKRHSETGIKDMQTFVLTFPFASTSTVIPIGTTSLNAVQFSNTTYRKCILILTQALSAPESSIRLDCLERIKVAASLFMNFRSNIAGFHVDRQFVRQMRVLLAEPKQNDFDAFIMSSVLPNVHHLEFASDPRERAMAYITAGSLQDSTAIPQLVAISNSKSSDDLAQESTYTLANFRTTSATVSLVSLLEDNSLRQVAADALRDTADPRSIPFLLQHLNDPDPIVVFNILGALATANNKFSLLPSLSHTRSQRQALIVYWKTWALDNTQKIKSLKNQFETAQIANPTLKSQTQ